MSGEWISASEAREMVSPGCKFVGDTTKAMCRRAAVGSVRAKASSFVVTKGGEKSEKYDHPVPKEFWSESFETQDWLHGDFTVRRNSQGWAIHTEALNVTFAREDIEAMAWSRADTIKPSQAAAAAAAAAAAVDRPKGGRPPKVDWEAVMIELARQLYLGELQPTLQADVENAIADYLSVKGTPLSESTIRDHARPLWQVIGD